MSVRVRCTKCRAAFLVPDNAGGTTVDCPKCGTKHRVPAAPAATTPATPGAAPPPPPLPVATPEPEAGDEVTSVFRPSEAAKERKSARRNLLLIGLLLLLLIAGGTALVFWPRVKPRPTDAVERVAEDYLEALVNDNAEIQNRLSVVEEPPAIRSFSRVARDKTRDRTTKGSFAPIAALNKRIDADFTFDPDIGRFTPKHPLGAAAETLDALHEAKAEAEKSGLYDKMQSGDPDDIFDAAEGLGQVFTQLAEGALAPKRILPTYKMLIEEADPPLPSDEKTLALDVANDPKTWNALLKRPFHTLKADGPFIYERAEVEAQITDKLGSLGDPPIPLRLSLVRFRLEGIDTGWRVVDAHRVIPGAPEPAQPEAEQPPAEPSPEPPPTSLGNPQKP